MGFTSVILVICIVLAVLAMMGTLPKRKGKSKPSSVPGIPQKDWQHLLKICLGDRERAMRLIQAEQKRNPKISPKKACRLAIERYLMGNR
ncbi:MAG: hypothetical protein EP343_13005 [Deltaproteobacteria bacterium]|nr:MAG: hypothetical protein EP343_13005 [Deltaproteobacteria bacterium]